MHDDGVRARVARVQARDDLGKAVPVEISQSELRAGGFDGFGSPALGHDDLRRTECAPRANDVEPAFPSDDARAGERIDSLRPTRACRCGFGGEATFEGWTHGEHGVGSTPTPGPGNARAKRGDLLQPPVEAQAERAIG